MNDERGTSWHDEPDRQRRHHPAIDRGHSIIRGGQHADSTSDGPGYPPNGAARPEPRGYPDPRRASGRYDPNAPAPAYPPADAGYPPADAAYPRADAGYPPADGGYPPAGYAGGHSGADDYGPYPGSAAPGYPEQYTSGAHSKPSYEPDPRMPGYESDPRMPGYEPDPRMTDPRLQRPRARDPRAVDPRAVDPRAVDPRAVDPRAVDPRMADPRAPGPRPRPQGSPQAYGRGYEAGGYPPPDGYDQGYPDQGYPDQGYPDQGYRDQNHPDQVYPDQGYQGQDQGFQHQGYQDQGFQDQGYSGGGFIEQGFGEPPVEQYDREDTGSGRAARRARTGDTDPRARRAARSRAAEPPPVDNVGDGFYESDDTPPKRRRTPVALAIMLVMLVVVGLGIFWVVGVARNYFGTPDYSGAGTGTVKVVVANGDTATAIADTLLKDGVVKSSKAFVNAATKDTKSRNIQAGTYTLHAKMSADNALKMLEAVDSSGNPVNAFVYKVTIPEGSITTEIYAALAKATGRPVSEFVAAGKDPVALGVSKSWFTGKTHNGRKFITSVEGFLFPATYSFQPDETPKQMLTDMVSKFNAVTGPSDLKIDAASKRLGMTPYEILITASIAQAEASTAADMAGVAEVILNRIYRTGAGDSGNHLGIDSEVNYWLKINGKESKDSAQLLNSDIHNSHDPYNTHDQPGLPPGAIGNPGRDALNAAMSPDSTKRGYYYWQTIGTNPKVVYAKTGSQFYAQQK